MQKNLTINELRIYKLCQKEHSEVYDITIYQLAERAYTTASSISKLVKKLGFNNFQEFKLHIRDAFSIKDNTKQYNYFINQYLKKIEDSLIKVPEKHVKNFCDFLLNCDSIITWGYGTSDSVAKYVSYNLMILGFNILNETDFTNCNVRSRFLTSKDCLLIVSNSGESEMLEEIILNAKKYNIKIAVITSRLNSTLARHADAILSYKNAIIQNTAFENISYPVQIAMVDILLFHLSSIKEVSLKFNSKAEDS